MNDYTKKQDELLEVVKKGIKDHYDEQKAEFEQLHREWMIEKENGGGAMKLDGGTTKETSQPSTPAPVSTIPAFGAAGPSVLAVPPGIGDESPAPPPTTDGANPEEDKERELFFSVSALVCFLAQLNVLHFCSRRTQIQIPLQREYA